MRIAISHVNAYRYAAPARNVTQLLRLTPRNNSGQHVARWRVEIDADARLRQSEDAFGNIVHSLSAAGPIDSFSIHVEGEVQTMDAAGVLAGAVERFPPELYLRATGLTAIDPGVARYAEDVRADCQSEDALDVLHALMAAQHRDVALGPGGADAITTAVDAFSAKRGVSADHAHLFCAMARHLDIPARYVSGYFRLADGAVDQTTVHAWAEAFVARLGWVGFDPVNCLCATEAHVRVAAALDHHGAAPVRGGAFGGQDEQLTVAIKVMQLQMQS